MNEELFPQKNNKTDKILTIVIIVLIALIILVLCLKLFVFSRVEVAMSSMENTLHDGDKIWINKCATPKENDIVVFKRNDECLIKRVIACGGDTIKIENGLLYIKRADETAYSIKEEDYIKETMKGNMEETTISDGCIFVMGDNRNNSLDSRDFGEIRLEDCLGIKI